MNKIHCDDFTAEIVRTQRRKTAAIKVVSGKVSVIVPKFLSLAEIESLVHKKQGWIKEKLALQQQTLSIEPKKFISGEIFTYLGDGYPLKIIESSSPSINFQQKTFIISVKNKTQNNAALIKKLLLQWYQQQAEVQLLEKTAAYAKLIGVKPSAVKVKSFKARWGSCSHTAEIKYNWKIIIAPEAIVDYLIVHELSHIIHHNHSPNFWQTVAFYLPDYKNYRQWLKLNGAQLEL